MLDLGPFQMSFPDGGGSSPSLAGAIPGKGVFSVYGGWSPMLSNVVSVDGLFLVDAGDPTIVLLPQVGTGVVKNPSPPARFAFWVPSIPSVDLTSRTFQIKFQYTITGSPAPQFVTTPGFYTCSSSF
jgi:hypothetical protein